MPSQSSCRFSVYATKKERQFLLDQAKARCMTLSRFIRSLADANQIGVAERLKNIQRANREATIRLSQLRQAVSPSERNSKLLEEAIALLSIIEQEVNA